ncbi:cytochrome p450 78a6 [Nicotiana attenuata]|uniref:Cytochrome p450 78a6 n=1 Tax=Nicotiana attenuata TaxID=49451 RepID=A0A1J6JY91_NICAT|nr:cytochrome p450 78a6 [Nicotiana attenuata]
MDLAMVTTDSNWWVFTLPAFLGSKNLLDQYIIVSIVFAFLSITLITWACSPGGVAWKNGRNRCGKIPIPGPRGFPIISSLFTLSRGLAHRSLASVAWTHQAKQLMAFSLGSTPVVVSSDPQIAKEILTSPHFADRPIKQSAKSLMFSRAIGFAPNGTYWRLLRRIASSHLFAPKRIAAHETGRQLDCSIMVFYDPSGIVQRCEALVPRVQKLVKTIIEEHRCSAISKMVSDNADFVDVLLSLDGEEKLPEDDMVAVLWEMIFRGTDTTTLLTEWVMAELILNPEVQKKLQKEVDNITMGKVVTDADITRMPYLQAVVKETLRTHPPGPLLSWARLSTSDVMLSNGMVVPSHTTAMVNIWAITHDSDV